GGDAEVDQTAVAPLLSHRYQVNRIRERDVFERSQVEGAVHVGLSLVALYSGPGQCREALLDVIHVGDELLVLVDESLDLRRWNFLPEVAIGVGEIARHRLLLVSVFDHRLTGLVGAAEADDGRTYTNAQWTT